MEENKNNQKEPQTKTKDPNQDPKTLRTVVITAICTLLLVVIILLIVIFGLKNCSNRNGASSNSSSQDNETNLKIDNMFKSLVNKQIELDCSVFNISNKDIFKSKFKEATGGEGKEINRITVLHSSSLCALLCFYNCEGKNLKINGLPVLIEKVFFEWENPVINRNSSMDVVVFGISKNNKKVIIFLESKFSEYINCGVAYPSIQYLKQFSEIYNEKFFKSIGLNFDSKEVEIDHAKCFKIGCRNGEYASGIKQMISHYIGVGNLIKGETPVLNEDQKEWLNKYKDASIYLGPIIFEFSDDIELKDCFEKYSNLYKTFAEKLSLLYKNNGINLFMKVETYQNVFKGVNLDIKVKEMYKLC